MRWYFTGDLGRFDENGEVYVLGRVDDMIISGGENIYAEEVEDVLSKSPDVLGVAIIGMEDERWGERVTAFVEPAGNDASPARLDAFCLDSGSHVSNGRGPTLLCVRFPAPLREAATAFAHRRLRAT